MRANFLEKNIFEIYSLFRVEQAHIQLFTKILKFQNFENLNFENFEKLFFRTNLLGNAHPKIFFSCLSDNISPTAHPYLLLGAEPI